jgi:aspartate aminotransferase-like enzyme
MASEQGSVVNAFFKPRMVTTGPTPVPEFVLAAMSNSVYYHRSPAFADVMQETRKLLPKVFGTTQETLLFGGTGTLAMEGAIANFFNPGDKVIAVDAGKFGKRWADMAKIYGLNTQVIVVERGQTVNIDKIAELLKAHPDTRGVLVHASETSTGVRHDVKSIAKLASMAKDCLTLVDGVTSLGIFNVPMDEWGVDVLVGGSQKGFMLPPGLSFGAASPRAWKRAEEVKNVRYYLDWRKERKANAENSGAFTSVVTLIGGLLAVLQYFDKEGLQNVYRRNWKMAAATRKAAVAMGFDLFVKNENAYSAVCTALHAEGSYGSKARSQYGLTISGGQDELKGKIVRIGHMGYIDGWDVLAQLQAIGRIAPGLGKPVDLAKGLAAFWDVMDSSADFTPSDLRTGHGAGHAGA